LLDEEFVEALYQASAAGVKIDLIIRGICAIRPGIKGLSENINVRSIIGQFLEHHRIYYFHANGKEALYLSSADWMDRNLFRRIEVAFPVLDKTLKQKAILEGLNELLKDKSAWIMNSNGTYRQSKILTQNAQPTGQQNLLLKYSIAAQPVKRKLKA
jgi:polyphosphate kinase